MKKRIVSKYAAPHTGIYRASLSCTPGNPEEILTSYNPSYKKLTFTATLFCFLYQVTMSQKCYKTKPPGFMIAGLAGYLATCIHAFGVAGFVKKYHPGIDYWQAPLGWFNQEFKIFSLRDNGINLNGLKNLLIQVKAGKKWNSIRCG